MGLKYLLDTNILSEPTKREPNPQVLRQLQCYNGQFCTAVTVWHELNYGVARMVDSRRKAGLQAYLDALAGAGLVVLPYEKSAGEWLAQARAQLAQQGISAPYPDGEIAAIAATQSLVLVTRNVQDFAMYAGLVVENWFE